VLWTDTNVSDGITVSIFWVNGNIAGHPHNCTVSHLRSTQREHIPPCKVETLYGTCCKRVCRTAQYGRKLPTFRRNVGFSLQERGGDRKDTTFPDHLKNCCLLKKDSFTLKMETVFSSQVLANLYQTVRRHVLQDGNI
jgi:hypothetical protein